MSQAAELERHLFDHRICSRIFANEVDLWSAVGVIPSFGKHSFNWTSSNFPDRAKIHHNLPSDAKNLVLVGMGGATLSATAYACVDPEGLSRTLHTLDSTSPESLAPYLGKPSHGDFHYVIASKSGETPETLAIADSLLSRVRNSESFTVITDPDNSTLRNWAIQHSITNYSSDPYVPGRFSALTNLALIPAAMLGIEIEELQSVRNQFVTAMAGENSTTIRVRQLAATLAFVCTSDVCEMQIEAHWGLLPVARWIEQLVAESLSKRGLGVLPVIKGIDLAQDCVGKITVRFQSAEHSLATEFEDPVTNAAESASLFLLWQTAVTMAAYLMGVNPYDQPEVDRVKQASLFPTDGNASQGEMDSIWPYRYAIDVYADDFEQSATVYFDHLTKTLSKNDYIAILAFVNPTWEIEMELAKLALLLESLFQHHQVRVVYSFGPQYLHSTGQYHKALAKAHLASLSSAATQETLSGIEPVRRLRKRVYQSGHFLFVEAAERVNFDVTGQSYTFSQMIKRQARTDAQHMMMTQRLSETTPSLMKSDADVAESLQRFSAVLKRTVGP